MGPWECRFAFHGHVVVFQHLDSGEKQMAMENSEMLEGTANADGELEGTELELSALNI